MTLLSPNFADSFKRYWTDPLFVSAFKAVRKDFLGMTGRSGLTGVPYVVLCLLMAQAMQRLLDGYSGSTSSSSNHLHEAVGFYAACSSPAVTMTFSASMEPRYLELVTLISTLQKEGPKFYAVVDGFLCLDSE